MVSSIVVLQLGAEFGELFRCQIPGFVLVHVNADYRTSCPCDV